MLCLLSITGHRGAVTDWNTNLPVISQGVRLVLVLTPCFNVVRINRFLNFLIWCYVLLSYCVTTPNTLKLRTKMFYRVVLSTQKLLLYKLGSLFILAEILTIQICLAVRGHAWPTTYLLEAKFSAILFTGKFNWKSCVWKGVSWVKQSSTLFQWESI